MRGSRGYVCVLPPCSMRSVVYSKNDRSFVRTAFTHPQIPSRPTPRLCRSHTLRSDVPRSTYMHTAGKCRQTLLCTRFNATRKTCPIRWERYFSCATKRLQSSCPCLFLTSSSSRLIHLRPPPSNSTRCFTLFRLSLISWQECAESYFQATPLSKIMRCIDYVYNTTDDEVYRRLIRLIQYNGAFGQHPILRRLIFARSSFLQADHRPHSLTE